MHQILLQFFHKIAVESLFPLCQQGKIVEKLWKDFAGLRPAGSGEKLWKNCRKILRALLQKLFLQFFHNYSLPPLPVGGWQNLSTIFLQFFHNSSLCGRIWCIRIGLEKNCRRNNRRKIVEKFGECRPWGTRFDNIIF
jgi:hypothetical protein